MNKENSHAFRRNIPTSGRHNRSQAVPAKHSVWGTSIRFTSSPRSCAASSIRSSSLAIAGILFPHQASGSLILQNGQVIGSELLAQSFTSDRYFHPRPSAAGNGYDATSSGGSNLAQSNAKLVQRIQGDIDKLAAQNPGKPVPIDLVTTSGSGLDPDITPDAAFYQAARVAKARGLSRGSSASVDPATHRGASARPARRTTRQRPHVEPRSRQTRKMSVSLPLERGESGLRSRVLPSFSAEEDPSSPLSRMNNKPISWPRFAGFDNPSRRRIA